MRAGIIGLACAGAVAASSCGGAAPSAPTPAQNFAISGPPTVDVGRVVQYTAATDAGQEVTAQSDWTSSDRTIATTTHSGLVTAIAIGTVTLSASYKGTTRTLPVTVTPAIIGSPSIAACGTIVSSGSYVLDADIAQPSAAGQCLTIAASGVRLDCRGHSVGGVSVSGAADVAVSNCAVTSRFVLVKDASNVVFDRDTALAIVLQNGRDNQVLRTAIDGGYDGSGNIVGSDDGILLVDQTNVRIEGNQIMNVWDAGIEGVDVVAGGTIVNNAITNAGSAGVASYWCTSWTGNTLSGNVVSRAANLFFFDYRTDATKCPNPATPFTFSNNRMIGNSFRDRVLGGADGAMWFAFRNLPEAAVTNNLIQGNDMGSAPGPMTAPASGFINGGGNTCGSPSNPYCGG